VQVVSLLIAAHADVNKADSYGDTPLHAACQSNRVEAALLLLHAGADLDRLNNNGDTPLDLIYDEETRAAFRLWDLANEYRANKQAGIYNVAETENQEEGGAGDAGEGDEGEQGETVAQRVAKRRRQE
jgi:ankyrin repeat protein